MNEFKDIVLASVTHDLRTPILNIQDEIQQVLEAPETNLSSQQLENLNTALKSCNRLHYQVQDLLDYSKYVKFETIRVNPSYFSLETLLKEIYDIFRIPCSRKGIELLIESNNLEREVLLNDKRRIIQILINLVGNSVKFTAKGHIKISVERVTHSSNPYNIQPVWKSDVHLRQSKKSLLNILSLQN